MLGRDSLLLLITAFQTLIKRASSSGGGEPISLSSTSIGSLIFLSLPLSSLSTLGSTGVAGDGGDSSGDGDGDGDGTGLVFCLFFAFFAFLLTFFLGGCKIAEAGAD